MGTFTNRAPFRRPKHFEFSFLVLGIFGLAFLCVLSVAIGNREVGFDDIVMGLQGHTETIEQAAIARRIPRTFMALFAGGALGLAGAIMQGLTRNPLADPGILGVNMGASLAIVIGIAFFGITSANSFIWVAIFGAAITACFVYITGSLGPGGATPLKLALAGAATSIAFSSMITGIVLPRGDIAEGVRAWLVGGVGGATVEGLSQIMPFMIVGYVLSQSSAAKLNALALGDDMATGLGERVAVARIVAALAGVTLCGAATAACGPIAFVGLVVPHFCRLIIGQDHRWLLPFSALTGAGLLIIADIIGRVIARPTEIQVGIIVAFLGAPFFIWIVRRQKVREL
ncbi:FecCD family ABC transporter permease [Maritalea sp. S77]|uniref:FecCD family ABC transporter permease n=1 Tax=Maritalea sp. S77 TaxID=3415125 RepID=UPI003C7D97F4